MYKSGHPMFHFNTHRCTHRSLIKEARTGETTIRDQEGDSTVQEGSGEER